MLCMNEVCRSSLNKRTKYLYDDDDNDDDDDDDDDACS